MGRLTGPMHNLDLLATKIGAAVLAATGAAWAVISQINPSASESAVYAAIAVFGGAIVGLIRFLVRRATTDEDRADIAWEESARVRSELRTELENCRDRRDHLADQRDRWRAIGYRLAADLRADRGEQPDYWLEFLEGVDRE